MTQPRPPMKPTRDPRVTLDDLVEVLLNKGAVLHLDLIVAVADIPLIGVSLRAAIAGMETMLEYGMLNQWDESTRAWAARSVGRRDLELRAGEELVTRMPGGHLLEEGVYTGWRPGGVHLTDQRLVVLRRDPREVLFEAGVRDLRTVQLETETTVGGEQRTRLRVATLDGRTALLSAADPHGLHEALSSLNPALSALPPAPERAPSGALEGHLWYQEPRRSGPLWRGGKGRLESTGLVWKSPLDARPGLLVVPDDILGARVEPGRSPGGDGRIVVLETASHGTVTLAAEEPERWAAALEAMGAPNRADTAHPPTAPSPPA
ncbi:gas vesicle protein [Streptomyces sp. UH6]|uniref:gas vesicle protein n=1 Tax=Streptomyces sp. UH6 TaxID=2748379 RepID=UPI00280A9389|nr:gas vesicle protein [Streptomyces sp. UH6]